MGLVYLYLVGTSGFCSKANLSVCKDYDAEYDEVYFIGSVFFPLISAKLWLSKLKNKDTSETSDRCVGLCSNGGMITDE